MNGNAQLAGAVLGRLVGLGVREFVVCAGARNVPLVSRLLADGKGKGLRVRPHFDERAAAFFALGLAKGRGEPVAVLTTSGTAAAELLPAAIEAHYSGLPLVLVTADRPAVFRGSGAPQAIEQAGLFGKYASPALDVSVVSDLAGLEEWEGDGPLHLNVSFEEPASGEMEEGWEAVPTSHRPRSDADDGAKGTILEFCGRADRLVVLLGELPEDWRPEVEAFLSALGAPAWAEATSGLRESRTLAGQRIASESLVGRLGPRQILRIGGVPSLRYWRDLENLPEVAVLSVSDRPFPGLARTSDLLVAGRFPGGAAPTRQGWVEDPTLLHDPKLEDALAEHPSSEPAMVRRLSAEIPAEALVFLGNSLPIREWNLSATTLRPHPRCFASRGANGIDGQVATFLGIADGEKEAWGIFGDLTALYDLNAPSLLDPSDTGKRRIVVLNNGGGRIFSRLPSMAGLSEADKRVTENRHSRSFESWAAMWELDYARWRAGDPFPQIRGDHVVLEVLPDGDSTEKFWEARR